MAALKRLARPGVTVRPRSILNDGTRCRQIRFDDQSIDEDDLRDVAAVDGPIFLVLKGCTLAPNALSSLDGMNGLKMLALWQTDADDEQFSELKSLPYLRSLHASGCHITERGLRVLTGARDLFELRLGHTNVGDDLLNVVAGSERLRELALNSSNITDDALAQLAMLHDLVSLNLSDCCITDHGVLHLQGIRPLKSLRLDDTDISDTGLRSISGLSNLQFLSLRRTRITDAGLVHLQPLGELRELDITDTVVSDRGVAELRPLPKLGAIYAYHTNVTIDAANVVRADYIGFGDGEEIRR